MSGGSDVATKVDRRDLHDEHRVVTLDLVQLTFEAGHEVVAVVRTSDRDRLLEVADLLLIPDPPGVEARESRHLPLTEPAVPARGACARTRGRRIGGRGSEGDATTPQGGHTGDQRAG